MTRKPMQRRPRGVRCRHCKAAIKVAPRGPLPLYCCDSCRQLAYQKRRYTGPMELLAQDIATMPVREVIRREVWDILVQLGIAPKNVPPPPKPKGPKGKQPELHVIPGAKGG